MTRGVIFRCFWVWMCDAALMPFLFRGGAAGRWNRIVSVEQLVRRLLSELAGYLERALIGVWLHVGTGYMD